MKLQLFISLAIAAALPAMAGHAPCILKPQVVKTYSGTPKYSVPSRSDIQPIKLNFIYDSEKYELAACDIFTKDAYDFVQADEYNPYIYLGDESESVIVCIFQTTYEMGVADVSGIPEFTYIIKEGIKGSTETQEINIDVAEATNLIEFRSYNPDGELTTYPRLMGVDPETYEYIWDYEGSNTYITFIDTNVTVWDTWSPSAMLCGGASYINNATGISDERKFDVLVNDCSDDIRFCQARYIIPQDPDHALEIDENTDMFLTPLETTGSKNKLVTNNPDLYHRFDGTSLLTHTPAYNTDNIDKFSARVLPICVFNGRSKAFMIDLWQYGEAPHFSICEPSSKDALMQVSAIAAMIDSDRFDEENWVRTQHGVYTPPMIYADGKMQFIVSNAFPYFGGIRPANNNVTLLPGHAGFSFTQEEAPVFGNSFPVSTVYIKEMRTQSDKPVFVPQVNYVGIGGELRTSDMLNLQGTISLDGETVCSAYDGFKDWILGHVEEGTKGKVTYTFTNSNYSVGNAPGKNTTVITYTEGEDADRFTPSLAMLQTRDSNGMITNMFDKVSDAAVQFSAGDFNRNRNSIKQAPLAEVRLEQALHGTEAFSPVEIAEDTELSKTVSGFGDYYRGKLSDVEYDGDNLLIDLRITLIDEAGNSMIQTISPAIGVGKFDAIDSIYADNGNLKGEFDAYNLNGVCVARSVSSTSQLTPGFYILRGANSTRKCVIR